MQNNLRRLIPFIEVAKCGSFAGAAAKLGVTSSAVSKSIASLESELGMRLLNRTTRRLHLTSEGAQLFSKITPSLACIDTAIEDLRDTNERPSGKIKISVGATFGRYSLMPALIEYMAQYPLVEMDLNFEDVPGDLIANGFDLGIHVGHGNETRYVSRVLCDYPIILVASPDYLARRGVPQTPNDLLKHECIGLLTPAGARLEWVIKNASRSRSKAKGQQQMSKAEQQMSFVPHGHLSIGTQRDINVTAALLGAGITPTSLPAALPFLRQQRLKVVLPSYQIYNAESPGNHIFILYPHREYLPPKLRTLIDFLVDWMQSHHLNINDLHEFSA